MNNILLFGPRINKKNPAKTGGVIVLFEDLVKQLEKNKVEHHVIDTNKENYKNKAFALISIYIQFITSFFKYSHISIHGTAKDYIFIAPFVVFFSKLFYKKVNLRKFAGNFDTFYNDSSVVKKKLIEFVLSKSDYNFFETKYLVSFFKKHNKNTFWFPNIREKQGFPVNHNFQKKFVFISQLYQAKGVNELLRASNLLPDEYTVDLYGPLKDKYTNDHFMGFKADYKGSLNPNEVLKALSEYDVLVLPTYYPGEGYPGIVIEALSLGKPVIVTHLPSIHEMVDERCAVFVRSKSVDDIVNAIMKFDSENYGSYSSNAFKAFEQFDSDVQSKKFLERINA